MDASAFPPAALTASAEPDAEPGPLRLPDPYERQMAVRFAVAFYVGMALVAFLLRAFTFDGGTQWFPLRDLGLPDWLPMLVAAAVALFVIAITRPLARANWSKRLTRLMQEVFGRLTIPQALAIGIASGVAEEYLFRGALQPWLGPVAATIIFSLLHAIGLWWVFALIMGAILAALYEWTGNLWPCILLHVMINSVNLYRQSHWLVDDLPDGPGDREPPATADDDAPASATP